MKKMKTETMVLCAMFTALSAILSQVAIPIGPVPISMTHISIFIAVGLLGAKYGTISQIIFVLLGAIGVPVFSGFTGGIGVIIGLKGGFIIGYIACALVTGLIIERFNKSIKVLIPAMYAGWLVTYIFGTSWYSFVSNTSFIEVLPYCVFPFLPGDIFKTVLSAILINKLSPILQNKNSA